MYYQDKINCFISANSAISAFCDLDSFDDLFVIQMRDFVGNPYRYTAADFADVSCDEDDDSLSVKFFTCEQLPETEVAVTVKKDDAGTLFWNIQVTPGREYFRVEWIDFPRVKFIPTAGTRYLIPNAEGTLISDIEEREQRAIFKCRLAEYPLTGIDSFYPGPAAAQFEAFYNSERGVYICCADESDSPKVVDFMPENSRVRPVLQQFTSGSCGINWQVEMRSFSGNWQDAADIYRSWIESAGLVPEKLTVNMPEVLDASPVVIAYPVKGFGSDAGALIPNEYYPYSAALPVMERYNKLWDNSVMALLMHWEGTAPWAPPFIWPPSGGEELLKEYVDAMHEKGNSVGLYSSGTAWTQKSMIDPQYSLEERFISDNVTDEICTGPRGEAWSSVCNHPRGQRIGYDLCPARDYTAGVVCKEVASAAKLGVDYLQYFDQNQGCTSPLCYSKKHGHPDLPGAWQTRSMQTLLDKVAVSAGKTIIGCENAAAQPYIKVCKLNDLRNHLAWATGGVPVALYSYLYHEYTSGFSGNGVWLHDKIDLKKTPYFLTWNLAWNFVSGNVLSVILKDKGDIHWNWCQLWKDTAPEQEPVIKLIANLSRHRRTDMKKYLVAGRMVKCPEVLSPAVTIYTTSQKPPQLPSVLSAAYSDGDSKVVILANSSCAPAESTIVFDEAVQVEILSQDTTSCAGGKRIKVTVPALDAVLVRVK